MEYWLTHIVKIKQKLLPDSNLYNLLYEKQYTLIYKKFQLYYNLRSQIQNLLTNMLLYEVQISIVDALSTVIFIL